MNQPESVRKRKEIPIEERREIGSFFLLSGSQRVYKKKNGKNSTDGHRNKGGGVDIWLSGY